jgi:ABC-type amino acid transport substrate-binding protein
MLLFMACDNDTSHQLKIVKHGTKQDKKTDNEKQNKTFPPLSLTTDNQNSLPGSSHERIFKIGAMDNYLPYLKMKEGAEFPEGFDGEMAQEIMKRTGLKYQFVRIIWNKGLQDLKTGLLDMVLIAAVTHERQKVYNFTDSYFLYEVAVVVHEDNDDIGGKTPEAVLQSLHGKKVAISTGYSSLEILRPHKEIKIVTTPNDNIAFELLVKKEVDAMALDKLMSLWYTKKHQLPLKTIDTTLSKQASATMLNKDISHEIIEKYNAGLKSVREDGSYDKIYKKWFLSDKSVPMKATQIDTDIFRPGKIHKIGIMDNYWPYMRVTKGGHPEGFDFDIVDQIMDRTAIPYVFVAVKWQKGLLDLKSGELSMLLAAAITPERQLTFNFTNSYGQYEIINFVKKDSTISGGNSPSTSLETLFGKKVALTSGYATMELISKNKDKIDIIQVPNDVIAFDFLMNAQADIAPNDQLAGLFYIKENNAPLKAVGAPLFKLPYATAVHKKLGLKIIEKYNQKLKEMQDDGTFQKIYDKWFKAL